MKNQPDQNKISQEILSHVFEKMLNGFALHRIILNDKGYPVDYEYLLANSAFERATGLQASDIIGKRVSEILPGIESESAGWIARYGEVALGGEEIQFEEYSEKLGKWFKVKAYSPEYELFVTIFEDISYQKTISDELRKSEEEYRLLVEASPVGIYKTDSNGNCVFANSTWLEMAGMTLSEARGMGWLKALHPEDREDIQELWYKSIESRTNWKHQYRFLSKTGQTTWVYGTSKNLYDSEKKISGHIGINVDITDKVIAENKIAQSEKLMSEVFNYLNMAICIYERVNGGNDFRFIDMNEFGEKLTHYKIDQVIGKTVSELFPGEPSVGLIAALNEVWKTGEHAHIPLKEYKDERIVQWVENNIYKLPSGRVMAVFEDTLERRKAEMDLRESEEKFRLITESSPDAIFTVDNNGNYVYVNKAASDLLGYSIEELKKMNVKDIGEQDKNGERFKSLKMTGYLTSTLPLRKKDGTKVLVEMNAVKLPNGLLFGSCRDLTERINYERKIVEKNQEYVKLNRRLLQSIKKAEESDKLKSAFLANVSHEIRTPMNSILGFADLLIEPQLEQAQINRYVEIIQKSGDRMLKTINGLIDISKIEADQIEVRKSAFELLPFMQDLILFFQPEAKKRGLALNFINEITDEGLIINTDKDKLHQILVNLTTNALKYTHHGRVELRCNLSNSKVVFSVYDTGIGIDANEIDRIFERFRRATKGADYYYEGAGLGLSIVKALVEILGGEITVKSEIGKGSEFSFYLPL
jgi:PAS domain S-box-containing protein